MCVLKRTDLIPVVVGVYFEFIETYGFNSHFRRVISCVY